MKLCSGSGTHICKCFPCENFSTISSFNGDRVLFPFTPFLWCHTSSLITDYAPLSRYVRMLKSPALYGVGADYQEDDLGLIQKRADIAHSAAVLLEKCQLIKYDRQSGRFTSTELGRIASYYYVTYNSMMVYNQHLRPTMSTIELFRVFALSNEFKLLPVSVF
jgi:replicative superfamily II helicase